MLVVVVGQVGEGMGMDEQAQSWGEGTSMLFLCRWIETVTEHLESTNGVDWLNLTWGKIFFFKRKSTLV